MYDSPECSHIYEEVWIRDHMTVYTVSLAHLLNPDHTISSANMAKLIGLIIVIRGSSCHQLRIRILLTSGKPITSCAHTST